MPAKHYLKHSEQWDVTLAAIERLSARLRRPFTYGEMAEEIKAHDGLEIDRRGFASALNSVAKNLPSTAPLWTVMVVNAETRRPGDGFWTADYANIRYREVAKLSDELLHRWLSIQQEWCIALARVSESPLDQSLRDAEVRARDRADTSIIDLRLEQIRDESKTT